jgi:hypothetical protein
VVAGNAVARTWPGKHHRGSEGITRSRGPAPRDSGHCPGRSRYGSAPCTRAESGCGPDTGRRPARMHLPTSFEDIIGRPCRTRRDYRSRRPERGPHGPLPVTGADIQPRVAAHTYTAAFRPDSARAHADGQPVPPQKHQLPDAELPGQVGVDAAQVFLVEPGAGLSRAGNNRWAGQDDATSVPGPVDVRVVHRLGEPCRDVVVVFAVGDLELDAEGHVRVTPLSWVPWSQHGVQAHPTA